MGLSVVKFLTSSVPPCLCGEKGFMNLLKTLSNLPRGWRDETLQYADRIAANGGSISQGSLVAIDAFVRACQVAGIWSKFIEVGPFAGANLNAAMVKLVYQPAAGASSPIRVSCRAIMWRRAPMAACSATARNI